MTKAVYLVLILFVLGFLCAPGINAQSNEITYQGSLKVSGLPANANYDFEFRLFDAVSGGTQVGPLVLQTGITVTDGVFSVKLNFGPTFPGQDRFLDITVRPAGSGGYTPLTPRQKVGSVPYAIQSINAGNSTFSVTAQNALSLGGIAAAQYVVTSDVRLTDPRNPIAGSPNYIQNSSTLQAASNFNVSGTGNANIFNAGTSFNFGGTHLLSAPGSNNVFVGSGSGQLNTSGNHNAFVGAGSGFENKGGFNNSFFGAFAGQNNSFGNSNSFFGAFSGSANTTGSENSFFGHRSGLANSAGAFNSFFGTFAGTFNSTGSDNSFFGNSTGFTSNGNRNSFFGSRAGSGNTSGSDNAFLGSFAGSANTSGSNNAFVGSSAGSLNATGINNSFFGSNSGFTNTASGNSFYGMDSGYFNTGGANNSFFGRGSGRGNTLGELNVFVGIDAGISNTLGSSNTIIGAEANVLSGNLNFASAIGAGSVVSSSNTLVLGRPVDAVRIPGNLNVLGTFTAANLSISASNITGVIGTANGGTGLALAGTTGNFLRSDGIGWQSSPFTVADIPSGSVNYIHNTSVQQGTSNFNISGNGTVGGMLSGNAVNAVAQFNLNGSRVLSNSGISNLFAGVGAGNANTTGASNSFFGNSAGSLNSSASGNSFFGASAGLNSATGANNTLVGVTSGSGGTSGANNSFFGANTGQTNTIGSNNTLIGSNSNVGANNLSYATAIGADAVVSINNSVVLGRTVDTVRVPGNLSIQGTLTANIFSLPATSITGVVAVANGGTGVGASGASGNYLRSNGSAWVSSAIASGDLPAGNANYIQNGTGLQSSSNFNVSGTGTVGGLFSANSVNSATQYNIGGARVFTTSGTNNVFLGAGTATSGDNNSFIGANAASSNTTGTSNTIVGSGANVGAGNLIFATALGSGAIVNDNNSVVLGRAADTVRVPGNLTVTGTFTAASFTLPAANITGVLGVSNGGTGLSASTGTNFFRGNGTGGWTTGGLVASDIPSGSANYIQNGSTPQSGSFNISGNGVIGGSLTIGGPLTGTFTIPAANISGLITPANGGTGLTGSTGTNFLRGNGAGGWTSSALAVGDIPSLGASYIQNGTGIQSSSNFNISGTGTVGGLFSAGTVNSASQYNIGGNRVFTTTGTNNVFLGADTATTGSSNTFVGDATGTTNTTGTSNTLLGSGANVGSGALSFATAIGSGAVVNNSDSLVLGRAADTVRVPGNLTVTGTFSAATFTLPAANITGVVATTNGGTGFSASSGTNFLRGNGTGGWTIGALIASDIPTGSANYVQNGTGSQAGASFNVAGSGAVGTSFNVGGNLSVGGTITGAFSVPATSITGVLARANGGTGLSVAGTSGNFLRSDGINWTSSALSASDIPTGSGNYVQNGTGAQAGVNFNVGGNGIIGTNLTVGGNLTVNGSFTGSFTVPAANISGVVGIANGGTGLGSAGANGTFLKSNGSLWTSSTLGVADIPNLGATYIQNGITPQSSSSFNIDGNGTAAGTLSGGTVNALTQYNMNGNRVFATTGTSNIFAGANTGTGGSGNSFFGTNAGAANSTGTNNTVIGVNAEVGSGALTNATAIGARAQVDQSNSLVLGGVAGTNGGANTSVGIGTTAPKAKLDVTGGNILVGTPGQGIILKSPDGLVCKLMSIDNGGLMVLTTVTCP